MSWNTKRINDLILAYQNFPNIKHLIRDISIDQILSDEEIEMKFPFVVDAVSGKLLFRSPFIKFEMTEQEVDTKNRFGFEFETIQKFLDVSESVQKLFLDDIYNAHLTTNRNGDKKYYSNSMPYDLAKILLHYVTTKIDKNILCITPDILDSTSVFYELYDGLPFFLKSGVVKYSPDYLHKPSQIEFDNGCKLKFALPNTLGLGYDTDFLVILDPDSIPNYLLSLLTSDVKYRIILYSVKLASDSCLSQRLDQVTTFYL